MESQTTRPYGHDQAKDPIRFHHPEEEEHQENGATKMLRKVKERAKKIKNSLTKHGHSHEHDHDVEEEDEEDDEQDPEPEVHGAPVHESSVVRGGVTGQPESLSHPGKTEIPAPEEIIPPGTKVFPVVSSDYTRPVEAEPLRDTSYGDEAPSHPFKTSDLSDREESRETRHESMNTPVPLLSATEDVTRTFAPGEDEYLGGQRKVNIERPRGLEEDPAPPGGGSDYLSDVSNYQSKVADPTQKGSGECGVPGIVESLGRTKVTDESPHQQGFETRRSHDFVLKSEHKDSSGGSGVDFPARSHEFDRKSTSPTALGGGSIAGLGEGFPVRSHEQESGAGGDDSLTGFARESGTLKRGDSPTKRFSDDSPVESHAYGEESGAGLEGKMPAATNDDVKVETVSALPTGTHDQFSPELSRPIEKDYIDSKAETEETKANTYTEKIASATSVITDKAIAAKNAVASRLGYSGGQQEVHETNVADETPRSETGYEQKVAGTVTEKLEPVNEKVKETGSTVMTKLSLSSGGGSGGTEEEERHQEGVSARDYLAEKLTPGEEEKALSEVIAEKLHLGGEEKTTTTKEVEVTVEKIPTEKVTEEKELGETVAEEGKGGGMVGMIKGWFGGATEETKPKSSDSVEESSQSLGSTVGTMGFSDSGGAQRGIQESGN